MIFKDYYKILSLETNRVSSEQIKNAYRLAAKKYHPDVNVQDRLSEEKIKDVNEAYRVLSNPTTKRKYDRMWVNNVGKKKYEEADYWRDFMDIVEIAPVLLGDANNDGRVDADDIEAITRYIMEGDDEGFIFKNADVNGDEKINAADIVEVVNIIKANK